MKECYQVQWDKQMKVDYCWNIKTVLNNIEHDNEERKRFYPSYVNKGFISTVSLLKELMKILVGFGIFNHVIFTDLRSD